MEYPKELTEAIDKLSEIYDLLDQVDLKMEGAPFRSEEEYALNFNSAIIEVSCAVDYLQTLRRYILDQVWKEKQDAKHSSRQ